MKKIPNILSFLRNPYFYIFFLAFFIITPTLRWSYSLDDIDNFYLISQIKGMGDFFGYLLLPGDGHFIPLFRLFYFICFKISWLNPLLSHLFVTLAFFLSGLILMKIIEQLTGSKTAGIFAGAFVLLSTGYTRCLEIAFSHFTLSLPIILFSLYSLINYQQTKKPCWHFSVMACIFIAPLFSAMGILTGPWVILFTFLCLERKNWKKILISPFIVWVLSVVIFLVEIKAASTIADPLVRASNAILLTGKAIWIYTLPNLTSYKDLSWFLVVFFFLMLFVQRKKINFKILSFFIFWIIGNYLFIYFGRGKWGMRLIFSPRYAFYASLGIASIICLVIGSIAQDKEWIYFFKNKKKILIPIFSLLIIVHAFYQHQIILQQTKEKNSLLAIGTQMESALTNYLQKTKEKKVFLEDKETRIQMLFPVDRRMSYYASFLLRDEFKKEIVWKKDKTEQNFIQHVKMNQLQYPNFFELLKDAKYF
ncbi:MAG: hypothetical protein PHY73_03280 [Candidatus Omnitrophica bacterium]|nr:hypothetical protein [Candidatus Omnitrophota bacterium]